MRVFENRRVWRVDPPALDAAVECIASAVRSDWALTGVVGVQRGGAIPAAGVAARLNLPCFAVSARHNESDAIRSQMLPEVQLAATGGNIPPAARLLVVDDVCGSGTTLAAVDLHLKGTCEARVVRTATLCLNAGSTFTPDIWVWRVRDWVVFPWESRPESATSPLPMPGAAESK